MSKPPPRADKSRPKKIITASYDGDYWLWSFKAYRISSGAEPFLVGAVCCNSIAEAFRLVRLTWNKGWGLIPAGRKKV